jgi:hypothetical protein
MIGEIMVPETIKTKNALVDEVVRRYREDNVELSETFFEGIIVSMSKADFIRAYANIQLTCNNDIVVRIDKGRNVLKDLIPDTWEWTIVGGDAKEILLDINNEKLNGGPAFARITDENELLDLVYGTLDG